MAAVFSNFNFYKHRWNFISFHVYTSNKILRIDFEVFQLCFEFGDVEEYLFTIFRAVSLSWLLLLLDFGRLVFWHVQVSKPDMSFLNKSRVCIFRILFSMLQKSGPNYRSVGYYCALIMGVMWRGYKWKLQIAIGKNNCCWYNFCATDTLTIKQ